MVPRALAMVVIGLLGLGGPSHAALAASFQPDGWFSATAPTGAPPAGTSSTGTTSTGTTSTGTTSTGTTPTGTTSTGTTSTGGATTIPGTGFVTDGWYAQPSSGGSSTVAGSTGTTGTGTTGTGTTGTGTTGTGTTGTGTTGTGTTGTGTTGSSGAGTSGVTLTAEEQDVLNWTNQQRLQNGLNALTINPTLETLAREKSQDMITYNYFGDNSPDLGSPLQMELNAGLSCQIMGSQNIAAAVDVQTAWFMLVNSPGHLANILYPGLTVIGIGVVHSPYGAYVTQLFAGNC